MSNYSLLEAGSPQVEYFNMGTHSDDLLLKSKKGQSFPAEVLRQTGLVTTSETGEMLVPDPDLQLPHAFLEFILLAVEEGQAELRVGLTEDQILWWLGFNYDGEADRWVLHDLDTEVLSFIEQEALTVGATLLSMIGTFEYYAQWDDAKLLSYRVTVEEKIKVAEEGLPKVQVLNTALRQAMRELSLWSFESSVIGGEPALENEYWRTLNRISKTWLDTDTIIEEYRNPTGAWATVIGRLTTIIAAQS